MRAIFILSIFVTFILSSCATFEVAKEVKKATNSLPTSIKKIALGEEEIEEKISNEKTENAIKKNKKEKVVIKQNKIATIRL